MYIPISINKVNYSMIHGRSVLEAILSRLDVLLEDKMPQNVALQMAFNARFAESLLLSREFKEKQ